MKKQYLVKKTLHVENILDSLLEFKIYGGYTQAYSMYHEHSKELVITLLYKDSKTIYTFTDKEIRDMLGLEEIHEIVDVKNRFKGFFTQKCYIEFYIETNE